MKNSKKLLLLISFLLVGCNNTPSETVSDEISNSIDNSIEIENSESISDEINSSEDIDIIEIESLNEVPFRLSSILDIASSNGTTTYKMIAPYNDSYNLKCKDATSVIVYNEYGQVISKEGNVVDVTLTKNQLVYVSIVGLQDVEFRLTVSAKNHLVELPYEINSSIDLDSLKTDSESKVDPLKPSKISYTKRDDGKGLYINSNNPEKITEKEFNTVLTRQEVTDKEVFFTFEHNNANSRAYYYGYRVTNTDDHDIYITVKNLGYQINGAGSWLGEDEWIKFYNTKFESDTSNYTPSQLANYQAYVSFSNQYKSNNRKPITYRIPSGKYIYVMGGTVADAYNNISVFDSANKKVQGGCGNGAVLFEVTGGSAEGAFMVYTNPNASTLNESEYVTDKKEYGYIVTRDGTNVGSQYIGYDNCHGVVDADLSWTFNDNTPDQTLPVSFTNPYFTTQKGGTPYSKIDNFIPQENVGVKEWLTHINPNNNSETVGTDMTDYITVDHLTKQAITLGARFIDGRGKNANIGNWMVDYIDTFTLVNQGNKTRKFTYKMRHNGVILAFVRDEKGFISKTYEPKYCLRIHESEYGEAIEDAFIYTVEVPAHSIVRFSVDYNLLANASGYIKHTATLD